MFKNCNAYTIADESEWLGRLSGMLGQIGFRYSIMLEAAGGLDAKNTNMLNFLIMHSSKSRDLVYNIARAVRASNDDRIRFMPIVVLLDVSIESEVHEFINLGCDDIVIFPCGVKELARRLQTQINTPREYFETENYFGPDRRVIAVDASPPDRNNGESSTYKHIIIKREETGRINILSETQHIPTMEQLAI